MLSQQINESIAELSVRRLAIIIQIHPDPELAE